ncbi:MAG: hypothetical protein AABW67_01505, partial [Nanoarchaeota archaeon]
LSNISNSFYWNAGSLGAGTYSYYYFAWGNGSNKNYNTTATQYYAIAKGAGDIEVYLNGIAANQTVELGSIATFNMSRLAGEVNTPVYLNGILVANGTFTTNTTTTSSLSSINITAILPASQNYTGESVERWIDVRDTNNPNVNSLTISPANNSAYSPSQIYQFNATISDISLNATLFEFNGVNYTTSNISNVYNVSFTGLGVGVYPYRWFANDTSGNKNNTESGSYTISQAASEDTGGGGGGGSSSSSAIVNPVNFRLDKYNYDETVALGFVKHSSLKIFNDKATRETFVISSEGLDNVIKFSEDTFVIEPLQSKIIDFDIVSSKEVGVYTGKIIVSSGSSKKEVLTVININSEKSLFDIKLTIPKELRVVRPGDSLVVQYYLLQAGLKEKMDVLLTYEIKDFNGKVYHTESETIAVENQSSFNKEFDTSDFLSGDYVLGTKLVYADGVAVASQQFKVEAVNSKLSRNNILLATLFAAILAIFFAIWIIIKRYKRLAKFNKER